MKRLIILGAVWAVAVAKPELYKEKEDFQFSRSSSDDGNKAGFYGAQRGNMGGNYERAHNMDSLAQNQMSGLVRQVEGELGDGAKTRTGSVYTAANSRGTFGSGHYDLGNLAGRNFQEGTSYDNSHSRSSLSSSSAYNAQQAGYANSRSQSSVHSGYQTAGQSGLNLQSDDLQSLDNLQGNGQNDYGRHSSHSAGYNAQSGFHQQSAYDSNAHTGGYGSNVQTRLISATPVRIIVRPGTRVAIPLAAQSYDITHGSSVVDQNSLASDAEVLGNDNQHAVYRPSNSKHYESSYNYRKEWEKHDTIPTVLAPTTPTENPFPKNSELYEDTQARTVNDQYDTRRVDSQRVHSSNIYGGYANAAHVKSASSQTRSNYDTQHGALLHTNAYTGSGYNAGSNHQGASLDSSSNGYVQAQHNAGSRYHGAAADSNSLTQAAYNTGFNGDLNSQVEDLNSKPKSYQSSYSYHKSWERQGDPYVIKPASSGYNDGQSSQRFTSSTKNQGYAAGSHYQHSHQSEADCDENGHIRVARSYNTNQYQEQQQSQNIEDLGQQVEDLGQQTQNQWGQQQLEQQAQNTWDNLEDLSQQSQNKWDETHSTWDKFEDLRQKTENDWEQKLKDTTQLENLDQNTQNNWELPKQQTTIEQGSTHDFDQENKWDSNKTTQHDEVNINRRNQDNNYEQSNTFNEQQTQSEPIMTDISKYFQPSQKPNDNRDDQISIWDKVDNFGSYQGTIQMMQNESKNEHVNTSDQFIWNKFPQNGDMGPHNLRSNNTAQNVNNNHDDKSFWEHPTGNTQQTYKIPDINEHRNTTYFNVEYYNNQNESSIHDNALQETHQLNESYNWNKYSSSHKHEQTTNTNNYSNFNTFETISSNTAPLSSLWNKIGNIEQQATLSAGRDIKNNDEEKYLSQVYTNSQDSNKNSKQYQTNQTAFTQQYNNNQTHYYHVNDIRQGKSNDTKTDKASPQDLGRGDIGPEDESHSVEDKKPAIYPFEIPVHEKAIHDSNKNKTIEIGKELHTDNLSVLALSQQKPQDRISKDEESDFNINNTNTQNNHYIIHNGNMDQKNLNAFEQNEYLQQMSHSFGQEGYLEQQQFQNFEANQNSQDFGQQTMQDFGQTDYLEQQSIQNVGFNNLHDVEQHQNIEQNLQDFAQHETLDQENLQDFGQHETLDQQHLKHFEQQETQNQQNLQDFGQHETLDQQNLQDFGQHETLDQQNLQVFGQNENQGQHLLDFGQQDDLEQQNLQNFDQQNLPDLVRHSKPKQLQGEGQDQEQQIQQDFVKPEDINQQNLLAFGKNENLEQQNVQDFGQQENFEQINEQDYGQQNTQDFGQQNMHDFEQHDFLEKLSLQNSGQQHLHDFRKHKNLEVLHENSDQQNIQDSGPEIENLNQQNLHSLEPFGQNLEHNFKYDQQSTYQQAQNLPNPKEIAEPMQVQKQTNDLQSNFPQTPNTAVVLPIEPVTEKPGFWKSVGNKFSTAKSKIASWFQS